MPRWKAHWQLANRYGQDNAGTGHRKVWLRAQNQRSVPCKHSSPMDRQNRRLQRRFPCVKINAIGSESQSATRKFLTFGIDEITPSVIDYHLIRSCLRVGLIDVCEDELSRLI